MQLRGENVEHFISLFHPNITPSNINTVYCRAMESEDMMMIRLIFAGSGSLPGQSCGSVTSSPGRPSLLPSTFSQLSSHSSVSSRDSGEGGRKPPINTKVFCFELSTFTFSRTRTLVLQEFWKRSCDTKTS